ncbi:5-methylaminomethyl-2-thiouridylate-methyltransferase [Mycena rosella]|uniref:tRNA-5-taurinomethyluridine 2-sulfurtransferase n=1 Tax=Mycena rosella TaxID=1033263 RepID=A0AAD7GXX8_MYCRO|nr:5-methylaminomethyl-2-thiouridylate-methyltransferase [Mycena rosella]
MSGGIDSSVSAKLLAAQDYDLSAVFMRNWDTRDEHADADAGCEWERDWADVQRVCRAFGIPCQMIDLSKEYWNRVFEPALRQWERGITPNPDVWCNREIKFGALLERLPDKGAWLATGHYARKDWAAGRPRLLRAADGAKDQSYYLASITEPGLARALFPIGALTKPAVRALAAEAQGGAVPESVRARSESMGLCFVGEKKRTDFKRFIASYIPPAPGPVRMLATGATLMEHSGLWGYTIGEGLRLPGMPEKMYVVRKDIARNTIFVGPASEPALLCTRVRARTFDWVWADRPPAGLEQGVELKVQVRHQMRAVACTVRSEAGGVEVAFAEPLRGVAPGQVAALWDGEWCLGCGVITTAESAEGEPGSG